MSKSIYGQLGNIDSSEITKIKLKVTDYVFEYKAKDLTNAYLEYYSDKGKYIEFKNGKKDKEYYAPVLFLNIKANLGNAECSFNFALEKYTDILNNLEINKPCDITEFINEGETSFQSPDVFDPIYFPGKDNFYRYDPLFKLTKLEENKFLFKIQCQYIFLWFIVTFE